jgi:hypothetical protein
MTQITDEMCRAAILAIKPDRIQGFSTPVAGSRRQEWGAPHYIRDVYLPPEQQEIWRGDSHDEMMERCALEEMRVALTAALEGSVVVPQDLTEDMRYATWFAQYKHSGATDPEAHTLTCRRLAENGQRLLDQAAYRAMIAAPPLPRHDRAAPGTRSAEEPS